MKKIKRDFGISITNKERKGVKKMKKALGILFVGLLSMTALMVSSTTFAAEETVTEVAPVKDLAGEVVAVDLEKGAITVKYLADEATQSYKDETVLVEAATDMQKDGAAITLDVVKAGEQITVKYSVDIEGKSVAKSIIVESKK